MNPEQARDCVEKTFRQEFEEGRFLFFIRNLVNHLDESKRQTWTLKKAAFADFVNHFTRLGTYTDPNSDRLDVLVIHLRKETTLARGRVTLRNFVADYLTTGHGQNKSAVIAAFVSPNETDWRFSFVKLDYTFEKTELGLVTERALLTPARRYSYLVGANENCHTAQKQFIELLKSDEADPTVEQLEAAFSVEKVTREFFEHYRELFEKTRDALLDFLVTQPAIASHFTKRGIANDDFAKKLLGQIVFLYFLQKKGWFGVERGKDWGTGRKDFIRHLFTNRADYAHVPGQRRRPPNYFNDILEPLFYEALAAPRLDDNHYYSRFDCKIPFLNGGLFEPLYGYNWVETEILLPDTLFSEADSVAEESKRRGILDVFDRYNFTVNEAEPLEKEVAVDPEMLGKVFENLLPENVRHSSGTYYTPRVIVHYMCQQALLHYLATRAADIPQDDLALFLRLAERFADFEAKVTKQHADKRLPDSISRNAAGLDELLATIAVCDPAIGSGAFPVGTMHEIVRARMALAAVEGMPAQTFYQLKRHAIHHSLYGVDLDPGAVEIAKLRLWLSMVVDEDEIGDIQPLPNLDYKIMQGNSLLEEFDGIRLLDDKLLQPPDAARETQVAALKARISKLQAEAIRLHGEGKKNAAAKLSAEQDIKRLKKQLDALVNPAEAAAQGEFTEQSSWSNLLRIQELHARFFDEDSRAEKDKLRRQLDELEWNFMEATLREQGREEAIAELKRASSTHRKPFFLWRLHFAEVFQQRGGFDVVIANPPYVSRQNIQETNGELFGALHSRYSTAKGRDFDLFGCFIERGVDLLRHQGALALIVPSGWYTGAGFGALRRFVATNTHPLHFINLPYDMFAAAWVDTTVMVCSRRPSVTTWPRKEPSRSRLKNFEKREQLSRLDDFQTGAVEIDISTWFSDEADQFLTRSDTASLKLLNRIKAGCRGLGDLADVQRGVTPFHLTEEPNHPACRPAFAGTVRRYLLDRGPQRYVRFDDSLAEIKPERYFVGPRLLLRELISRQFRLQATFAKESFITNRSMQSILGLPEGQSLLFLLGVLNSSLMSWLFLQRSNVGHRDDFPKIVLKETRDLPIPTATPANQTPLERLVERILSAKQRDAGTDVSAWERELDELVYALYGLTPEEIKLVEGSAK